MPDDTQEVRLPTYIAVELLPRMTPKAVAERIVRGGKTAGTWFRRLEEIGQMEVAARRFLRFQIGRAHV